MAANNVVSGTLAVAPTDALTLAGGVQAGVSIDLNFANASGATVVFEKNDGAVWTAVSAKQVGGTFVSSATASGAFEGDAGSCQLYRVRLTAITSGYVLASLTGTEQASSHAVHNTNPANLLTTSATGVVASDGTVIPVDSLPQTLSYNTNGTLNTITVTYLTHTYVQTYSYNSSSQLTGISNWVQTS